jgi:hypothetical protein
MTEEQKKSRIEELKAELDRLERLDLRQQRMDEPEVRIAVALHTMRCGLYCSDGCGWAYEDNTVDTWLRPGGTKRAYLTRARKFLNSEICPNVSEDERAAIIEEFAKV